MKVLCRTLNVSRAGYYAWRGRPASERSRRREAVIQKVRLSHARSRQTYGSPRVTQDLLAEGEAVCENTVARYMGAIGLRAAAKKRFVPRTTDSVHPHPVAANVLKRDFSADASGSKWVSDQTYLYTDEGWVYLSIVLDCFSRRIVGWALTDHLRSEGPQAALEMALGRCRPKPGTLIHHSDRGSQYACVSYRVVLDAHGITPSMSRPGNCYDNAMAESFFGTLKTELVHRERYATRAEAESSVFEWIECWYNRRRRHSSLGYLSPEQFEAQIK